MAGLSVRRIFFSRKAKNSLDQILHAIVIAVLIMTLIFTVFHVFYEIYSFSPIRESNKQRWNCVMMTSKFISLHGIVYLKKNNIWLIIFVCVSLFLFTLFLLLFRTVAATNKFRLCLRLFNIINSDTPFISCSRLFPVSTSIHLTLPFYLINIRNHLLLNCMHRKLQQQNIHIVTWFNRVTATFWNNNINRTGEGAKTTWTKAYVE